MTTKLTLQAPSIDMRRSSLGLLAVMIGIIAATQPIDTIVPIAVIIVLTFTIVISPIAAISILLIVAPLRALLATAGAWPFPLDAGQIMFLVAIGATMMHYIKYPSRVLDFRRSSFSSFLVYLPIILFVVAGGLTAFSAVSIGTWLTEWLKWLSVLIMMVLVANTANKYSWQWICFLLVLAAVANALVGIYIFLGGSGADHFAINERFFRAFGTFEQPNPFGGFMGLIAPIALMMTYVPTSRIIQSILQSKPIHKIYLLTTFFYGTASAIIFLALVMSWSRGAWLGFAASLGTIILLMPRKIWHSFLLVTCGLGLIAALWFTNLLPASIIDRLTSATSEYFTLYDVRGVDITSLNYAVVERLAHWQAALNMARENPWLGVGLGNYEIAYDEYRLMNWEEPLGHAHNYYLNILGEAGIIGALSYVAMWITIIYFTWQVRQSPDQLIRSVGIGLFAAWVYLSIHGLLDNLYVNNMFLHIGALLGVLVILYRQTTRCTKVRIA